MDAVMILVIAVFSCAVWACVLRMLSISRKWKDEYDRDIK